MSVQCAPASQYKGALDCLMQLVKREVGAGSTTLTLGHLGSLQRRSDTSSWMGNDRRHFDGKVSNLPPESDASLHNYRNFLLKHGFDQPVPGSDDARRLSLKGHTIAGLGAGWSK
jgi:hypothetical protein